MHSSVSTFHYSEIVCKILLSHCNKRFQCHLTRFCLIAVYLCKGYFVFDDPHKFAAFHDSDQYDIHYVGVSSICSAF